MERTSEIVYKRADLAYIMIDTSPPSTSARIYAVACKSFSVYTHKNTARPSTRAPTAAEATPICLALTVAAPLSLVLEEADAVSAGEPSLPVAVGLEAASPYSEVMEAMTLLREGSANTACET
jgi:hypothetical protein